MAQWLPVRVVHGPADPPSAFARPLIDAQRYDYVIDTDGRIFDGRTGEFIEFGESQPPPPDQDARDKIADEVLSKLP